MAAVLRSGRTSAAPRSMSGPPAYSAASSSRADPGSPSSSSSSSSSSTNSLPIVPSDAISTPKTRQIVRNAVRRTMGLGRLSTALSATQAPRPPSPLASSRPVDPLESPESSIAQPLSPTLTPANPPSYSRDNPGHIRLDALDVAATALNADLPTEPAVESSHDAVRLQHSHQSSHPPIAQAAFPQLCTVSFLGAGLAFQTYFQAKGGDLPTSPKTQAFLAWSWVAFILAVSVGLIWQVAIFCSTDGNSHSAFVSSRPSAAVLHLSLGACTVSVIAGATLLSLAMVQDATTLAAQTAGWIFPILVAGAVGVATFYVLPHLFKKEAAVTVSTITASSTPEPHVIIEMQSIDPPPPFSSSATSTETVAVEEVFDEKPSIPLSPQPGVNTRRPLPIPPVPPPPQSDSETDSDSDNDEAEEGPFEVADLLDDNETLHTFVLCYAAFRNTLDVVRGVLRDFDKLEYAERAPMLLGVYVAREGDYPTIRRPEYDPVTLSETELETIADFLRHLSAWEPALKDVWSDGFAGLRPEQMALLLRDAHVRLTRRMRA